MMLRTGIVTAVIVLVSSMSVPALERPDVEFKIFQFPRNMMPRIDGDTSDWTCVPEDYAFGIDQLEDTITPPISVRSGSCRSKKA